VNKISYCGRLNNFAFALFVAIGLPIVVVALYFDYFDRSLLVVEKVLKIIFFYFRI
jgi:hypothetical protein